MNGVVDSRFAVLTYIQVLSESGPMSSATTTSGNSGFTKPSLVCSHRVGSPTDRL